MSIAACNKRWRIAGILLEVTSAFKFTNLSRRELFSKTITPIHTDLLLCNPRSIIRLILKHISGPKTYQKYFKSFAHTS